MALGLASHLSHSHGCYIHPGTLGPSWLFRASSGGQAKAVLLDHWLKPWGECSKPPVSGPGGRWAERARLGHRAEASTSYQGKSSNGSQKPAQ